MGYVDSDRATKQQKALPPSLFRSMLQNTFILLDKALGPLSCGAFFFGMRMCKFLMVTGKRNTKRLKVRNIRFFKDSVEIKDKTNLLILYADTVGLVGNRCHYIEVAEMYDHITNTVNNTRVLGFTGDDVGNHSIRSSLAMTLYLAKRSVSTIMLIGCWSSDAFLLYVRRQVLYG